MIKFVRPTATLVITCALATTAGLPPAQQGPALPPSITTPEKVESRIGTLEFKDGLPSKATLEKVYENLDMQHAMRAFADTFQGVSIHAIRKGMSSIGEGQRGDGLLGPNGCEVAVPDGQRRYCVYDGRARPDERPDGHRGAAAGAGHGARFLVSLGDRRRSSGT